MVVRGRDVNGFMPQCGTVEMVWINQAIRLIFEYFIEIVDVLTLSRSGGVGTELMTQSIRLLTTEILGSFRDPLTGRIISVSLLILHLMIGDIKGPLYALYAEI